MNKKLFLYVSALIAVFLPIVASAQTRSNLSDIIIKITGYANVILVLMMAVAVVMFVFYVIKYFVKADANRAEGGTYVMYSLIGFFVILSFWGLVNILLNTFGLQNDSNRPSGWTSFTNIFPGGSSGTRGSGPVNLNGTNTSRPVNLNGTNVSPSNTSSDPYVSPATNNPKPAQNYYDFNSVGLPK
jgi:hypothetical protein